MAKPNLGPGVPDDVADALKAFCGAVHTWPTSPASGAHPNDRERFARFVILAHQQRAEVDAGALRDYFLSRGEGPEAEKLASQFVHDYEFGRDLLRHFDHG